MIYLETGVTTAKVKEVKTDSEFEWITDYPPMYLEQSDMTEYFKKNHAQYFIAGTIVAGNRNSDTIQSRKLICLDYDDITDEMKFLSRVAGALDGYNAMIYPTFNYGIKGARYRVIIDTDREYYQHEFTNVMKNVASELIGISADRSVAQDWQKPVGLPLITPNTVDKPHNLILRDTGKKLVVDDFTHEHIEKPKNNDFTANYNNVGNNTNGNKSRVVAQLERAMSGIQDGERNDTLTSIYGTMVTAGMGTDFAMRLILDLNDLYCEQPLSINELETMFASIERKRSRGGGTL